MTFTKRHKATPRITASPGYYGCTQCRQIKPASEFCKQRGGPGGHSSHCKLCKQVYRTRLREKMAGKPDATIERRFWAKVDKRGPDECWPWLGSVTDRGYGKIFYQGADTFAHRVAVILAGREMPADKVADHKCKNTICVNERHLRVCTQTENTTIYADNEKRRATAKATWAKKRADGTARRKPSTNQEADRG